MKLFLTLLTTAVIALAADAPSFEAASIRPAAPSSSPIPFGVLPDQVRFQGGPGTSDPLRIRYMQITLQQLLARAYGLELLQVSGPSWIANDRYDITATLPSGTNQAQLQLMLQGLLSERFKVQMRHESKTVRVYELSVASGGPKLKTPEDVVDTRSPEEREKALRAALEANMARIQSGGPSNGFHIPRGTIQELIRDLLRNVDRPIVDHTMLTGSYSFDLQWTPASMNSSGANPDLFAALEEQMGLKLSARNDALETIVVESAERAPEN